MFNIRYLGTGASEGIPAVFCDCRVCRRARIDKGREVRSRQQALVDGRLLIDFGPDTFLHAAEYGLRLSKIKYCLVTHAHYDHLIPQEILARSKARSRRTGLHDHPLTVIGGEGVEEALRPREDGKVTSDGTVLFEKIAPYETKQVLDYEITALPANHPTKMPLVYVIKRGKDAMLYAHDSARLTDECLDFLVGKGFVFRLVSLDCSDGLKRRPYRGHMNYVGARIEKREFLRRGLADAKTVFVLSHIGHLGGMTNAELAKKGEGDGFKVAYDGLKIFLRKTNVHGPDFVYKNRPAEKPRKTENS